MYVFLLKHVRLFPKTRTCFSTIKGFMYSRISVSLPTNIYIMKKLIISVWAFIALPLFAQRDANIRIYPEQGNQQISKHIYGQFAEHLGSCIYGGLWVGPESDIPNTQGYRTDVLNALKKLQIPNLRWPGGCFADEYHWMDGIGRKSNARKWWIITGEGRLRIIVSEPMSSWIYVSY